MPLDPATFRATLGRFASGVTVVTTRDAQGRDAGMTVSAFSSLSLSPPLVLVCIDRNASVGPVLEACDRFAVNILAEDQAPLSRRFAEHGADRFDGVALTRGETGTALLDGALAALECRTAERHAGGDHTILVGEVLSARVREGQPLVYYRGGYRRIPE